MPRHSILILTIILLAGALAPARFEPPPDEFTIVDWGQIESQIDQHQHTAVLGEDGSYWTRHHRFDWTIRFDGRGFEVKPDEGDWAWGLELVGYGVEGAVTKVEGKAAIGADKNRVSYAWDDALEEWYVNERRGIEHGFTVKRRPAGEGELLVFELAVRGGLEGRKAGDRGLRFMDASGEAVVRYEGLKVWDADGAELPARLEALADGSVTLVVDDGRASYPITVDPIAQRAYLKASNPGAEDRFGWSVAVSGDTVVVGARFEDGSGTGVNAPDDNSGFESGAAYVFERIGGVWSQQAYLKGSNTGPYDEFGRSVAVSGDTVVVGARFEDGSGTSVNSPDDNNTESSGAAYVFERTGGVWSQQAYLKAFNSGLYDNFGTSVAVSGDTVVVGAVQEGGSGTGVNPPDDNNAVGSGAAYVFKRAGGVWSQQAYLKASNPGAGDRFGWSVAVSGDTVVVGARSEDGSGTGVNPPDDDRASHSGAAYVFERVGEVWRQQAYLKASNPDLNDVFGSSVAVSGNTIAVGAVGEDGSGTGVDPPDDNNAESSGAAYVFERTGGVWSQPAYLKASNTQRSDLFGHSVAVSGDTVVVSAPGGDGAAYVFERTGEVWSQRAYLKASNTDSNDKFGYSVAVSGDTVVVGAWGEYGSGTGVNPPDDNNARTSGAAYLFGSARPSGPARPSTTASFIYGHWIIDRNGDGVYDRIEEIFDWGVNGSIPLKGDWNGDGYRDLGVFSDGVWFLDLNGDRLFDAATETKGWGLAGWTPITGDWNGDGITDLGAIDPATMTWFLDLNGDMAFDPATEIIGWGSVGNTPFVGDWDCDGDDDIGVFADGVWFRDVNGDRSFDPATEIKG